MTKRKKMTHVARAAGSEGGEVSDRFKNDFAYYLIRKEATRAAVAEVTAAQRAVDLARIYERLAEIRSQYQPLNGLLEKPMSERDKLYSAAYYVVNGKFPSYEQP
jgi:hypothetical protein